MTRPAAKKKPAPEVVATREQLVAAFEAWITVNRLNPQACMSEADCRKIDARAEAELSADVLIKHLADAAA